MRVAAGSGRPPSEVQELIEEYGRMRTLIVGTGAKGQGGLAKALGALGGGGGGGGGGLGGLGGGRGGPPNPAALAQLQAQMGRMLPPGMLQQMGGAGALQGLLKSMEGMK
jgi:signal recognition particle subunit SRP54